MANPILGYDIDGQPLRAGDRVVIVSRLNPRSPFMVGDEVTIYVHWGEKISGWDGKLKSYFLSCESERMRFSYSSVRKLPPKQDHEPGSWEEIAKLGWKPEGVEA